MTILTSSPSVPSQDASFPRGEGYNALLGSRWYRTAATRENPIGYVTRDSIAERRDQGSVYENVLSIGYVFARGDCSGGEGLDWFPRFTGSLAESEDRDRIRYWDSKNIDVRRPARGELSRVTLSKKVENWRTLTNGVDLATSDEYLFIAYGNTVEWYIDWDGAAIGSATTTTTIASIEASAGGDLVALLTDGTLEYLTVGTSTFTPIPALADIIDHWFAKGRFIAQRKTTLGPYELLEFDQSGVIGVAFDTLSSQVLSLVSSGPAVVAAVGDGTLRSYVPEQSNQLDPDSVSLVIRGITETPEGEVPYLLGSNADILLILTRTTGNVADNTIRLYRAEVLDARFDYIVGQLGLQREWRDTAVEQDDRKNMANTRDEILFLIRETPTTQDLWRFDLVTFGLSRQTTTVVTGEATSLVIFDDRGGFLRGNDIWRESALFQDEGYIISPNITFGINTPLNWIATVIAATGLSAAGKQVELWYSTDPEAILDADSPSWRLAIRASSDAQSDDEVYLSQVQGKQCAIMLRLFSAEAGTKAANVNNWAIRGLPSHRDWILQLPINVSDIVEAPGRRPITIAGYGDVLHRNILSLVGESLEIQVLEPPLLFRGVIDNISETTEYVTDRGSSSVRCIVQARGERITATTAASGDNGLGIGTLGVALLGVGQTEQT